MTVHGFDVFPAPNPNHDPFEGPKLKIEWAKRHVANFSAALQAFTKSDIARIIKHTYPETGGRHLATQLLKPLPGELQLLAADALHNLRTSLDQAVSCCARLAGHPAKDTYFPHGKNRVGFEASLTGKCKKVPEPVRNALTKLEPYYGGNGHQLEVLHNLNLVDKHSDLLSFTIVSPAMRAFRRGYLSDFPKFDGSWDRVKDIFYVTQRDIEDDDFDTQFALAVVFADFTQAQGDSATEVLYDFVDIVGDTVAIIEKAMLANLPK